MSSVELIETLPIFPHRDAHGHKGTFGTTLVIGGCAHGQRMLGGPCLAAEGALRSGCGLAVLGVPEPLLNTALGTLPEATGFALTCASSGELGPQVVEDFQVMRRQSTPHSMVIGPGLGRGSSVDALVKAVSEDHEIPRVIDADALNAMAHAGIHELRGPAILTPHPGEWRTMARNVGLVGDPITTEGRMESAIMMARALDAGGGPVVVVVKGPCTVVSDGHRGWSSDITEPALAVGGSGDVLAGVMGGLLAQWHPRNGEHARDDRLDAFEIACCAVAIHGEAGRLHSASHGHLGMLAREIAAGIPVARGVLSSR